MYCYLKQKSVKNLYFLVALAPHPLRGREGDTGCVSAVFQEGHAGDIVCAKFHVGIQIRTILLKFHANRMYYYVVWKLKNVLPKFRVSTWFQHHEFF